MRFTVAVPLLLCAGILMSQHTKPLPKALFNKWVHSSEEDSATTAVYRPVTHSFPLLRGRLSFEITPKGDFFYTTIGRDDRMVRHSCTWKAIGNHKIIISSKGIPYDTLTYLSVSDSVLKIKKFRSLYKIR